MAQKKISPRQPKGPPQPKQKAPRTGQDQTLQAALRESETKFRSYIEAAPDGVFIVDQTGRFIEINQSACRITGYSEAELKAMSIQDLLAEESLEAGLAHFQKLMETGKAKDDLWHKHKDGSKRCLTVDAVKLSKTRVIGFNKDITEQKLMGEALRDSEASYRALFEANTDGILIADLETKLFKFANPAICQMLQYTEEELRRLGIADIHPQADLPWVISEFEAQARGEKIFTMDLPCRRKDGTICYADVHSAQAMMDNRSSMIGIFRDTAERKRAEQELRIKEERYRELFDNISSGVAVYEVKENGEDFIFVDFNKAGEKLDGDRREELIGKSIFEVRPGIKEYGLLDVFKRVWQTGVAESFPAKLYQDGRLKNWYENFVYRLPTGEIVALYNDITERKQAEEKLVASEVRYRRLFEAARDGILILDAATGTIIDANPCLIELLGCSLEELSGAKLWELGLFKDIVPNKAAFLKLQQKEYIRYKDLPLETADGQRIEVEFVSNVYQVGQQQVIQCIIRDITELKRADEALRRLSTHDMLTGLYSRGFFMEELARLERGREFPVSIVSIDVDQLKDLNDQHGHIAGDTMLKNIAQVLTAAFRAEDVVARLGGDEFAVLLPGTDAAAADAILRRVRQIIQQNNVAHPQMPISLSLGVSTAASPGSLLGVLQKAEANMYFEKKRT